MSTAPSPYLSRQVPVSRLLALAVLAAIAAGVYLGLTAGDGSRLLFTARFPRSGLVTNEYAYFNPRDLRGVNSTDWVVTSGSLFATGGSGWTGVPDGRAPDPSSSATTDSAVFRLLTRADGFKNVTVSFRLRLRRFVTTPRTPAQTYDGVHVWLRYQNANCLYFASVSRRDGEIVIGKKVPAGGGRYYHLVRAPGHPFPVGRWEQVRVTIASTGNQVIIRAFVGDRLLARMVDDGSHGQAIQRPGHVGIRGDNADFEFRDFKVTTP